jgi:hypothetical protein
MKMKKIMIAAAIVCATVLSQAATVSWSLSGLQNSKGEALSGYAYVFTNKGDNKVDQATLIAALSAATDAASFTTALGSNYVAPLSGAVTAGSISFGPSDASTSGLKENQSGTKLFAVVIDTATVTDETKWYVTEYSNTAKVLTDAAVGSTSFDIIDTGSHTAANWQAVPEPTSGLLLLLGVAGLALRRKQK